jgi:hypothetical protein
MTQITYKQGMTTVWSDGEKIIIKNPSSFTHVKDNVEQIFGMGEFDKIKEVKYSEELTNNFNPHSKTYELISGYIPNRIKIDLQEKSLPGIKDEDITEEYFK